MIEAVVGVLIALAINTVFLILCMHVAGKWFGIDFGPLGPGILKVMAFLLVADILLVWLGPPAFLLNILVYFVGFKVAFNLDIHELMAFVITYMVLSWVVRFVFLMLIRV